jgi:acetoin utilization deacetylase AcuC-like enzyme
VSEEQILRFHTRAHLEKFKIRAEDVQKTGHVSYIDSDTGVMKNTAEAAYRAAGAAVAAVDSLYLPEGYPGRTMYVCSPRKRILFL